MYVRCSLLVVVVGRSFLLFDDRRCDLLSTILVIGAVTSRSAVQDVLFFMSTLSFGMRLIENDRLSIPKNDRLSIPKSDHITL
jgi:hypothetical protein